MVEAHPDRIISTKEKESLKKLLISQNLGYPNYNEWVENTINQISEGKKIAFGIFTDKIEADGVIRITASDTVELKNFFVRESARGNGFSKMLIEYIERFCIEHGCTQIQVDSFVENKKLTSFLIKNDYQFSARGDFYGDGTESYLMIKSLPVRYIGDYDWFEISDWVMRKLFCYHTIDEFMEKKIHIYSRIEKGITEYTSVLFSSDLDNKLTMETLKSFFETTGLKGSYLCFAPYFEEETKAYANQNGIILIDRSKLEELSLVKIPHSSEDIVGLIVPVKPEYYQQLVEATDRVFIKGGSIPSGVEKDQILLFYVTSPDMSIKGYTTIQDISNTDPKHLWAKHSTQSAFSEEEYQTYTAGKLSITAFSFDEINVLDTPIDLDNIRILLGSFNHQAGQRITAADWNRIKGKL